MIFGFVGTPGSGKSYDAVKKILDNLKMGRVVYTNIEGLDNDFCQEYIKAYAKLDDYQVKTQLRFMPDKDMKHCWVDGVCEIGSLLVIDEVHKLFSNRNWQSPENQGFAEWLSTHRHHGFDVVLITQDLEKVEKHARSLIEWTYFYRKVNFFGSLVSNRYLRYTYSGDDHNGQPLSKDTFPYDKKVFSCYKSFAAADIKEQGIMKGVNVLRHPVFYAIPCVLAAVLYMGSKSSLATGDVFGANKALHAADKLKKHPAGRTPGQTSSLSKQAVQPGPGTVDQSACTFKVQTPDGVTLLVSTVPPGSRIIKSFGCSRQNTASAGAVPGPSGDGSAPVLAKR